MSTLAARGSHLMLAAAALVGVGLGATAGAHLAQHPLQAAAQDRAAMAMISSPRFAPAAASAGTATSPAQAAQQLQAAAAAAGVLVSDVTFTSPHPGTFVVSLTARRDPAASLGALAQALTHTLPCKVTAVQAVSLPQPSVTLELTGSLSGGAPA